MMTGLKKIVGTVIMLTVQK